MPRWGLLVEPPMGQNDIDTIEVLAEVDGTREEALTLLAEKVETYQPRHPRSPRGRRLYRTDDGWLLVIASSWSSRLYPCRFRVCELVWDSGDGA
ncbi:hypothetical protein [Streptomyces buecherae]|uniref:Uncharacterized protein n=1 Tax=Streptomyces buecherae TaxID=2763006 RepID=A0A7G8K9I1_9ACTN|nr:hypothetical protein [Streptomyces buecherae]MBC3981772.1 hypothetical protein [Streptomyces buecherae]QKW52764.1 hypothetical protein HUT08_28105 [Streptomyces buecherae]QNJ39714.1 hypothetical protein H7H31_07325 [Streptomyces buecherae]